MNYGKINKYINELNYIQIEQFIKQIGNIDDISQFVTSKIFYKLNVIFINNNYNELPKEYIHLEEVFLDCIKDIDNEHYDNYLDWMLFSYEFAFYDNAFRTVTRERIKSISKNSLANFMTIIENFYDYDIRTNNTSNMSLHNRAAYLLDMLNCKKYLISVAIETLSFDLNNDKNKIKYEFNIMELKKLFQNTLIYQTILNAYDKLSFGEYFVESFKSEKNKYRFEFCYRDYNYIKNKYKNIQDLLKSDSHISLLSLLSQQELSELFLIAGDQNINKDTALQIVSRLFDEFSIDKSNSIYLIDKKIQAVAYILIYIQLFFEIENARDLKSSNNVLSYTFSKDIFKAYLVENELLTIEEFEKIDNWVFVDRNRKDFEVYKRIQNIPIINVTSNEWLLIKPDFFIDHKLILSDIVRNSKAIFGQDITELSSKKFNEDIKKIFVENGYECLGTDIKIKLNNKLYTDIDGVYIKDNVVVLLQAKSTVSSKDIFSHFNAYIRIKDAAMQAQKCEESNSLFCLYELFSKYNLDKMQRISIIVTNNLLFNMWKERGYIVISFEKLEEIIKGNAINNMENEYIKQKDAFKQQKYEKTTINCGLFEITIEEMIN